MPSAEDARARADAAYRERRVARLRRSRRRLPAPVVPVLVALILVAIVITGAKSDGTGSVARDGAAPATIAAVRSQQAGTECVGWPIAVTPSVQPAGRNGSVTVWGDRSAFHLRNLASAGLVVEVHASGGSLRPGDQRSAPLEDGGLRVTLAPGMDARFTASCSTTSLRLTALAAGGRNVGTAAFSLGGATAGSPLTITKVRR